MNILYLIDNPQLYGSEMHVYDLLSYQRKHNNVFLVSFRDGPLLAKIEELGIKCKIIPSGYFLIKNNLNKLIKYIYENKIDIIHAHQPKALLIGVKIRKIVKKSLVITIHSLPEQSAGIHKNLFKKLLVYEFHSYLNRYVQYNADAIIFVSKVMLAKSYRPDKSYLIYNWLRPSLSDINIDTGEKGLSSSVVNLLAVGSVTSSKGYDILFHFLNEWQDKNKNIMNGKNFRLTIVGGIPDYTFIDEQKKRYPHLFDQIKFEGYKKEIEKYYLKADFFILFSKAETFGLVYIEAMFYGLPVIACNIPVLREIVPSGNCLVDNPNTAYNYISRLIDNKRNYLDVCKKNRNYVKNKFCYEKSMKQVSDIYNLVIHFK